MATVDCLYGFEVDFWICIPYSSLDIVPFSWVSLEDCWPCKKALNLRNECTVCIDSITFAWFSMESWLQQSCRIAPKRPVLAATGPDLGADCCLLTCRSTLQIGDVLEPGICPWGGPLNSGDGPVVASKPWSRQDTDIQLVTKMCLLHIIYYTCSFIRLSSGCLPAVVFKENLSTSIYCAHHKAESFRCMGNSTVLKVIETRLETCETICKNFRICIMFC